MYYSVHVYIMNITVYYTPTLLCARITHFQPCTITQSSERISGQKLSISYFARILSFCPHTAFRPSPGFATYIENDQWASGVFNQRIASDYFIVTSYLNAFNLLNYNDICLYKHSRTPRLCCNVKHSSDLTPYRTLWFVEVVVIFQLESMCFFVVKLKFMVISCEKMHMISILVRYGFRWHSDKPYRTPSKPISHSNGYHMHIICNSLSTKCISNTMVILMISDNRTHVITWSPPGLV